jgi:hypothetical protein
MKVRATCFAILLCVTSLPLLGQAGAASGTDAPASREDIKKMFEIMHIHDQMKLIMDQVSQQTRTMAHEQIRKLQPDVTDKDIAKLDAISDEAMKGVPVDGLLDDMIPVYQKHLSKSDVDAMIGFYSTATGQKILKEMPAMTRDGMQAIQPRLRQIMDDANARVDKIVKEQIEDKKQDSKPN